MSDLTWAALMGVGIGWQALLEERDPVRQYRGTIPRLRASTAAIGDFESSLGEPLDASYRDFLLHADGWPGFHPELDLFGLPELAGKHRGERARALMAAFASEGVFAAAHLSIAGLLPVAAGDGQELVTIVRPAHYGAGTTFRFTAEGVEQFDSFKDLVIDLTDELCDLAGGLE